MAIEIISAGQRFLRPGGREGRWRIDPKFRDPDDTVESPFDFVVLPGADAVSALVDLKRLRPNATPMLFGSPHEAGILFERIEFSRASAADWIAKAGSFDLDAWVAQRQAEHEKHQEADDPFPPRGPWPEVAEVVTELAVPNELLKPGTKPTVIIGLLPTPDPTEAAAYLRFGNWNDCPDPCVHICFARRWRERYGAVQASNTYESVEFRIAKPLTDRREALDLAWVQYHYCTDSIPGTLDESAAGLVGSTVWHFWWD